MFFQFESVNKTQGLVSVLISVIWRIMEHIIKS